MKNSIIFLKNKYKELSIVKKASIWYFLSNILTRAISLITLPLFTRLLTVEEYGNYSIYLSWLGIFTVITSLNLYYGVLNNALNKYRDEETRSIFISSLQAIVTTIVLIIAFIYSINYSYWDSLIGLNPTLMILMFIELIVSPSFLFFLGHQRFDFKFKESLIFTLLKSLLNPILSIIFIIFIFKNDKSYARIFSVVLTEVLISGSIYIYYFYKGKFKINFDFCKYALKFNIPLLPHYLAGTLLSQLDRIMIEKFVGKGEVAIYSVAYNISMLTLIFTTAITSALTPWIYEKLNQKDYKSISKNISLIIIFVLVLVCMFSLFSPEIILIFGGNKYYEAVYIIPPICISVLFILMSNIFTIPQMYYEYKNFMSISSIFATILNFILNYIFINIFGYMAAAYTTLICYVVYCIGHYIIAFKIINKIDNNAHIFNTKVISLVSIISIILSISISYVYSYPIIRYLLLIFISIYTYYKKEYILNFYKNRIS